MIGLGEGVWSWRIEGGSIVCQLLFCSTMVLMFLSTASWRIRAKSQGSRMDLDWLWSHIRWMATCTEDPAIFVRVRQEAVYVHTDAAREL